MCIAQEPLQGTLRESSKYACDADCPPVPLPGSYTYCFDADGKIIIAEHSSWAVGPSQLAKLQGQSVGMRYDDFHVWVKLPNGLTLRLSQDYHENNEFSDESCRAAAHLRSLEHGYTRPEPVPGEPAKPVMKGNLVFGWALCTNHQTDSFSCTVWDLKGNIRQQGVFEPTSSAGHWNDADEGTFKILNFQNGRVLRRIEAPTKYVAPVER
ncbi:MAG: hypothetical protein WB622_14620 [Acidobacteriaceae bacterium]